MKKLIFSLLLGISCLLLGSSGVLAADKLFAQMTDLPEYKNTDTFKLSYTALQVNDQLVNAQFWYMKDGDVWRHLGSAVTGTTGSVETNGSYTGSDAKYFFKVEVTSDGETVIDETSTTIDRSGPGAPSEYSKERINPTTYKISWKTPGDNDFSYVAIYRSTEQNFTADNGSLIAKISGSKDTKMSSNDGAVIDGKDYFYALRAVDKAGNASGVVGDGGITTTVQVTPTPGGSTTGNVNLLPKENTGGSSGQILGGETESAQPTPESQTGLPSALEGATKAVSDMGTGQKMILILIILGLIGGGYYFFKNKSSE
jgi:hypothetical protein